MKLDRVFTRLQKLNTGVLFPGMPIMFKYDPQVHSSTTILRLPVVKQRTGLSRSTIYLRVSQGAFPQPIDLGGRAVGWVQSEVEEWIARRIALSRAPQDAQQ